MAKNDLQHPGARLAETLAAMGLSITDAAAQLGVSRITLSRFLNSHADLSFEMALRLEAWLGEPAADWLAMQTALDLADARAAAKAQPLGVRKVSKALLAAAA